MDGRLDILTWHVHGNYLYYLSQVPHDLWLPVDTARSAGYGGRCGSLPWGPNVHEIPVDQLAGRRFDVVLYQSLRHWREDRLTLLDAAQRRTPAIYLEHDPPLGHPTDSVHPVEDPAVRLVHVTHYNALMWDAGARPVSVVEHGVHLPRPATWRGDLDRGIVVVNHLARRGRRLGADLVRALADDAALDVVGMGAAEAGGLGEVANVDLAACVARYRFFFHPARYTSLGLAVIEAMMIGCPVVGLATTELAGVIRDGETGWIDTRPDRLLEVMRALRADRNLAAHVGDAGRREARRRFGIERFVADWCRVLEATVAGRD